MQSVSARAQVQVQVQGRCMCRCTGPRPLNAHGLQHGPGAPIQLQGVLHQRRYWRLVFIVFAWQGILHDNGFIFPFAGGLAHRCHPPSNGLALTASPRRPRGGCHLEDSNLYDAQRW